MFDHDLPDSLPGDLPHSVRTLAGVRDVGCTGVTLMAVEALAEIADEPARLRRSLDFLRTSFPGYATFWHLANISQADNAREAIREFGRRLAADADASVEVAKRLLASAGRSSVEAAPSSSLVRRVIAGLGDQDRGQAPGRGLSGADAIGPDYLLNIVGTHVLASRVPTVVVTTSSRLVPPHVFDGLGSPLFERVPLDLFEALVIDGEVLSPGEARVRSLALSGRAADPVPELDMLP